MKQHEKYKITRTYMLRLTDISRNVCSRLTAFYILAETVQDEMRTRAKKVHSSHLTRSQSVLVLSHSSQKHFERSYLSEKTLVFGLIIEATMSTISFSSRIDCGVISWPGIKVFKLKRPKAFMPGIHSHPGHSLRLFRELWTRHMVRVNVNIHTLMRQRRDKVDRGSHKTGESLPSK